MAGGEQVVPGVSFQLHKCFQLQVKFLGESGANSASAGCKGAGNGIGWRAAGSSSPVTGICSLGWLEEGAGTERAVTFTESQTSLSWKAP